LKEELSRSVSSNPALVDTIKWQFVRLAAGEA